MTLHTNDRSWVLETAHTAYALGLNEAGLLTHRYWGPCLPFPSDYPLPANPHGWASFNGPAHLTPEEFPAYAGTSYVEPCLKVTFTGGVRDTVLCFVAAETHREAIAGIDLTLKDNFFPLRVILHYRAHEHHDLIERWVTLVNEGKEPIQVERVFSALWHVPPAATYRLSHLTGRWLDEFHLERETLRHGVKVLESRRLTTSHHHSPWFALDAGEVTDTSGNVWFGSLAWSGNWKLITEVTSFGSTRAGIGLNDWDFVWTLEPGETFSTPHCLAGFTTQGFGAARRLLHDHVRDAILPHSHAIHPILYNSWEATHFDVDEVSQGALAELAAKMGVELFVMDDGWFHGRKRDTAGLGDWWPDREKFPNGLTPLIDHVKRLGMQFGLWVEPEMVNPDSDLYRTHPDWVIHFPNRSRTEARHQLILNLGRSDVQGYLIKILDLLLSEHDIRFIKWDMNRNVSEPGWPDAPRDARELWVRYVYGVYHVWGSLRQRHPNVIWQSCSGGGGRADYGILRLADQVWVSDNTEAAARLHIQEGFSQFLPATTMEAWVTDANAAQRSLDFRFHVSMCGSLGIGGHLGHWSEEERTRAAEYVAHYKRIRPLIQRGDQYIPRSLQQGGFTALQYVAKDKSAGVLFAFRTHLPHPVIIPPLYLQGLDPTAHYRIEGFSEPRSGAAWMHSGLFIELRQDFESTVRSIERV
ncbi:MAG: alpha-galactosidase [Chloroflexi bacterium]|nr:alpha-galactosidase [Chloroflexota bacterium]